MEKYQFYIQPEYLQAGDLIYITAPAKAIDASLVENARLFFERAGLRVLISEHCAGRHNYFSGTETDRLRDIQAGIDNPEVKAILCARGGYGCIQISDSINWAGMLREPKWLIGFSDITVFHQKLQRYGIKSIHATMPLNFEDNTTDALDTLLKTLTGKPFEINCAPNSYNKTGKAEGVVIGGNLSILFSLIGTDDQPDYTDSILFIEDLSEQLYHIDRIFHTLRKSGVLNKIKGLVVGGMTDMKDTAEPFGKSLEEIILSHFEYRKIPVCFGFPAGHIADNRAIVLGSIYELNVSDEIVNFRTKDQV